MFLALLPFHFVSCRHNMSTFLRSIISASSLPLPVILQIFKVPTLMIERLPFYTSRYLFTCLHPVFLLLFLLCLAVAQFPQMPCCATLEAVVGNPTVRYGFINNNTHLYNLVKVLRRMHFLPQPSPNIRAWDRHQETQKCASDDWV